MTTFTFGPPTTADAKLSLDSSGNVTGLVGPDSKIAPSPVGSVVSYYALWHLFDPTTLDSTGTKFNLNYSGGQFTDATLGTYVDNTVFLGFNFTGSGQREDTSKVAGGIGFESKYTNGGSSVFAQEYYYRHLDASGNERRPFGFYLPYDGQNWNGDVRLDYYVLGRLDTVTRTPLNHIKFNFVQNKFEVYYSDYFSWEVNNTPTDRQLNAAGNAYLRLPYVNNYDNYVFTDVSIAMYDNATPIKFKMASNAAVNTYALKIENPQGQVSFAVGGNKNSTSWVGEGWFGSSTTQSNGSGMQLNSGPTTGVEHNFSANIDQSGTVVLRQAGTGSSTYLDVRSNFYIRDWANAAASLLAMTPTTATFNMPIRHRTYTVGTLPSASTVGNGSRAFVSDALAPTFGATVAAGGAVYTPVYSDGTNWKVG